VLLKALLGLGDIAITRDEAIQIPTVQACVTLIANTISRLPLQLLRKAENGDIEVVGNDRRVRLLNDDTGDTLTAKQFWRAIIEDYYLGRGGYAYINRHFNQVESIHYVRDDCVSVGFENFDPIFKEYELIVQGARYRPFEFFKVFRKTRDGMRSVSIIEESPLPLRVAYEEMKFELSNAKKGGAKRGYLQTEKLVSKQAMDELKSGFKRMYGGSDDDEPVIVLNNGIKFQEASATAAELQMNENKESNSQEICKLFGIPASMICGSQTGNSMTDNDMNQFVRACVAVMVDIECSLNRDLLMEDEKGSYYWQFDTKELTRGSIKERYEAYKIGLEQNFLQIDEVREKEDMEPLGIDWLQLNLNTVFYNPETKQIYTPNTNASMNLEDGGGVNAGTVSGTQPAGAGEGASRGEAA
jgi:HK97 family phage portal protein